MTENAENAENVEEQGYPFGAEPPVVAPAIRARAITTLQVLIITTRNRS